MRLVRKFLNDGFGATSMEYGLVALIVSVVAIAAMRDSGNEVNKLYTKVDGSVTEVSEK